MRHVQEEQTASCFGGCKVSLPSPPTPPIPPPLPSSRRGLPNVFGAFPKPPKPLGPLRLDPDCAPNTVEVLRVPLPGQAERSRAPPSSAPSTFPASAGRCPPLTTPETSPRLRRPRLLLDSRPATEDYRLVKFRNLPLRRKRWCGLHFPTPEGSRQMQHAPCCKEQFPRPRLPIHLDCTSPRETPGQITGGSEG